MQIDQSKLDERPFTVKLSFGLMMLNVVILAFWWLVFASDLPSFGSQAFFMVCWSICGSMIWFGQGWIRWWLAVLLVAFTAAWINTWPNSTDNLGTLLHKLIAFPATALLFFPNSHRWFKEIAQLEAAVMRSTSES